MIYSRPDTSDIPEVPPDWFATAKLVRPAWYGRKAPPAGPLTGLFLLRGCKTGWLVPPESRPSRMGETVSALAALAGLAVFVWWVALG